jgi:hypothetical protein
MTDVTAAPAQAPAQKKPDQSYDLQRRQIQDEERRRQQTQQEALQRRLSTSGFQHGSGHAELQSRRLGQEMGYQEQARLSEVDVAQRQAEQQHAQQSSLLQQQQTGQERLQAAEHQQQESQFGRQFGLATRAQTAQETQAEAENRLKAQIAEMQNSVAYREIASREGMDAANRAMTWQVQESNIAQQQEALRQQYGYQYTKLAQEAGQFARSMGLSEAEAQRAADEFTANLLWEKQSFQQNYQWEVQKFRDSHSQQMEIKTLESGLMANTLNLQHILQDRAGDKKLMLDNMYSRGIAGEVLDTSRMTPAQANAYQMGLSGAKKEDYDRQVATQQDLLNSMIINASTPAVAQRIATIYAMFGYQPGAF